MTAVDFIQAHRNKCATTDDWGRLVLKAWAMQHPAPSRLPWLWIEPSHPGARGLFSFRASADMGKFLASLHAWFDVQYADKNVCVGQVMLSPTTFVAADFNWLVAPELALRRECAMHDVMQQPTMLAWWSTFASYTPLWLQCMFGWCNPTPVQLQQLQWGLQNMTKMLPLWVRKTQAYYGSTQHTVLSWAIAPDDHLMPGLALVKGALDSTSIAMNDPDKTQLLIAWRKHAPVLLALLDLQGGHLCNEYNVAEIPHDFLMNSILKNASPPEYYTLPEKLLD